MQTVMITGVVPIFLCSVFYSVLFSFHLLIPKFTKTTKIARVFSAEPLKM